MNKLHGSDPKSYAGRPKDRSELLGQVFTPPNIAHRMATMLLENRPRRGISIVDPAIGPGTFQQQLHSHGLKKTDSLYGFDIDSQMIAIAKERAKEFTCNVTFLCEDYLKTSTSSYDYAILNPPYVRQEWLDNKEEYRRRFLDEYAVKIPGTSNLYVYFLSKVIRELKPSGKLVCILYDSWQTTRFGKWLSRLLHENCSIVETHSVESQPFDGCLIDATIIKATRNAKPFSPPSEKLHAADTTSESRLFTEQRAFSKVSDLFQTARGLRLKQADFFLCSAIEGTKHDATIFVKKPANIGGYAVLDSHSESALLISDGEYKPKVCKELMRRLESAMRLPDENQSILTWFKEHPEKWYLHRKPPFAPLLFNYYLRNRPKHFLNRRHSYSDNFYGLVPYQDFSIESLFAILNSTCVAASILSNSRNQGNGLAKIQLYEYRDAMIPNFTLFGKSALKKLSNLGECMLDSSQTTDRTIDEIDTVIYCELSIDCVKPKTITEVYEQYCLLSKRPRSGMPSREGASS